MRYQFFICKPRARCDDLVSWALRAYLAAGECRVDRQDLFSSFDIERQGRLLRLASGESAGFSPRFKFRQVYGLPLLAVKTEYRKALEVADALAACLGDEGLKVFDGEMECRADIEKGERVRYVAARLAHQRLRCALQKTLRLAPGNVCAWAAYFNLGQCFCRGGFIDTGIVILKGDIRDAVRTVDVTLRHSLLGGEALSCSHGCFVVENKVVGYSVRFVVEGTGKSAQYMGWVEDGEVRLEMLHRMSLYLAAKRIGEMGHGEESCIRSRLYFNENFESRGDLRNPADRFVDSYNISKRLKKSNLDIIYGRHPLRGHNEFAFYDRVNQGSGREWDSWKGVSIFTTTEEQAMPLLAILESVVPYYFDEYYYKSFYFRKEEVQQILERIKVVRRQIRIDPCDSSLGKILERLLCSDFAVRYSDGSRTPHLDDKMERALLMQNRFRIVELLDFFSWWLTNAGQGGFYVEGP